MLEVTPPLPSRPPFLDAPYRKNGGRGYQNNAQGHQKQRTRKSSKNVRQTIFQSQPNDFSFC